MHPRPWTAAVVVAGLLATGCSSGGEAVAAPTPTATPTPTEPPAPEPVAVTTQSSANAISDDDVLVKGSARTPMDPEAVQATINAITDLVTIHLDDVNTGGTGTLASLATDLVATDPTTATWITDLAGPDNPAVTADLRVDVHVDGAPLWAQATVDVVRRDGSQRGITMVIDLADPWRLVLLGGEDQA